VHLDPLVIAIGRAAGVRDLADAPRRCGQEHRRRIHIACHPDGRIDQRGAHSVQAHELLAHQEARHVEIVDHHVPEQPARPLDIGDRRRRGIAGGDGHKLHRADIARRDAGAQRGEIRDRSGG
jgi:hypothetical protein